MTEQVLSDDEVDALLDGVESGEIEVHSAGGPRYASVRAHEIPRRSRIVSKNFPRLELLNEKFAARLQKHTRQLLHCELGLSCTETTGLSFGDICAQHVDALVAVEFAAAPLHGHGAIVFGADLVHQLVELFFGGAGSQRKTPANNGFTIGEYRVIHAYTNIILDTLQEIWEPILALKPERSKTESGINLLNIADETDQVIRSSFDFSFAEHCGTFHLLLPNAMVETLLPLFKGTDRKADQAQDDMWADAIRTGLLDIKVRLSSNVGHARMTLGELICLEPGHIIGIDSPRFATLFAQNVPLLEGRFGVHGGRNAVEASRWLGAEITQSKRNGTHG